MPAAFLANHEARYSNGRWASSGIKTGTGLCPWNSQVVMVYRLKLQLITSWNWLAFQMQLSIKECKGNRKETMAVGSIWKQISLPFPWPSSFPVFLAGVSLYQSIPLQGTGRHRQDLLSFLQSFLSWKQIINSHYIKVKKLYNLRYRDTQLVYTQQITYFIYQ